MSNEFGILTKGQFPTILTDPHADERTQPFWDAARQERLVAPRCTECGTFRMPPSPYCFNCRGQGYEYVELPGTATIYTFTVVRHALHPDLTEILPYVGAVVELDGTQGAGARMIVNIVDCDVDDVRCGDRVEVVWEHVNNAMTTPRFRPVR